ncbi:MAG: helix-turn-helix domain-containing protein, partial [Myxococcota bacterium]
AEIGRRIRDLRMEKRLSLKQLANRAGVSLSLISQVELARSAASVATLYRILTALGVTLTAFFEMIPD